MVVTLLNWIYIFATAYILGFYCLPRVAALIDKESRLKFNWCDNIVAGIVIATVYAGFFSLIRTEEDSDEVAAFQWQAATAGRQDHRRLTTTQIQAKKMDFLCIVIHERLSQYSGCHESRH